jgi:hypothetical protein
MNKEIDIVEELKTNLRPFLESDWILVSLDDETEIWKESNFDPAVFPQITSADAMLWSAQGKYGMKFTLAETSCNAKIRNPQISFSLPTEHIISLFISNYEAVQRMKPKEMESSPSERQYLKALGHGYDFLIMDEIAMKVKNPWLHSNLLAFFAQITQAIIGK